MKLQDALRIWDKAPFNLQSGIKEIMKAARSMADPNKVAMQQVVLRYQPDFDDPDYVDELWDAALSEDRT